MRSLHLFAGVGGGILADKIVGNVCVGAIEIDPFRRSVLKARQEDGLLEKFPIFNDVKTYKGTEIENAELICGGFPCQDISGQNCRGAGIRGEKSGLFFELLRIVGVVRPRYVFLENSPFIRTRGLDVVLTEFTRLGYDSEWTTLSAFEVGAPHVRNRWWGLFRDASTLSDADRIGQKERQSGAYELAKETNSSSVLLRLPCAEQISAASEELSRIEFTDWEVEPDLRRMVAGVPARVDAKRIEALGNAQAPLQAAVAYLILMKRFNDDYFNGENV